MRKLQVWRTIKDANVFIYAHKDYFWRLAILPMCIYFAVYFVYFITVGKGIAMSMADFSMQSNSGAEALANFPMKDLLLSLVPAFILSLLTLPFIVAWHRLVLLGPEAVNSENGLRYSRREWTFYFIGFVIFLILYVIIVLSIVILAIPLGLIAAVTPKTLASTSAALASPAYLLAILMVAAPFFRYCLALPSISLNRNASLGAAWRLGKGNSYRLAWIIILTPLPTMIVLTIITLIIFSAFTLFLGVKMGMASSNIVNAAIGMVYAFVIGAIVATALSICYRTLTEAEGLTENPST